MNALEMRFLYWYGAGIGERHWLDERNIDSEAALQFIIDMIRYATP